MQRLRFTAAGTLVCVVILALSATAGATAAASAKVTPRRGVRDGQSVTVTWKAFDPAATYVAIMECSVAVLGDGDNWHCDVAHERVVWATKRGSEQFVIRNGRIGDQRCGTTANNAMNCVVRVAGLDDTLTSRQDVFVRIAFGV